MTSYFYGQLIYSKGSKNIQWEKDSLFKKWCWENRTPTCKIIKLHYLLIPHTNINSKWIQSLITPETIKLLGENIGSVLTLVFQISFGGDICPQTRETKVNINKCDCTKLKSFGTAKETINKMKSSTELREMYANCRERWCSRRMCIHLL